MVSPSLATGSLTVSVVPRDTNAQGTRVHLIGGAGSAVNLTRELYRLGCSITGGIAHEHDSDEKLWKSLGIRCTTVGAFSRITDEQVGEAASFVEQADLTILCSFPIGVANVGNLRLAARARRLVVVKTGRDGVPRTFFSQEGSALFDQVCAGAHVLDHEAIIARLVSARDNAEA
jgi:iron complex transport system ATP-binding protein